MANSIFKDKTLLITGGTGSFGHTVLKHFLTTDIGEIRIFSRDEKKQDDMRHELQAKYPAYAEKVKFYIGDVRNPRSLRDAFDDRALHEAQNLLHSEFAYILGIEPNAVPQFIAAELGDE